MQTVSYEPPIIKEEQAMVFQREKQNVTASEILSALVDGNDIQLNQCTLTGVLDINRLFEPSEKFQVEKLSTRQDEGMKILILSQTMVFDKCIFEENVVFCGPWSEPEAICVEFKSDVIFNSSVFKGQGRFRNAVFYAVAGFDGCGFEGVSTFKNAVFNRAAKFRTVNFGGYFLCGNAVFKSSARFTNSHFSKGANFSEVRFETATDFSGVYSSSRAIPAHDSIYFGFKKYGDDVSFWRFVKQSAQEAGYYQLAGECFYKERCGNLWQKMRGAGDWGATSFFKKISRWVLSVRLVPELVFGKILFGYGERPGRVLGVSALIILGCAFFYARAGVLFNHTGEVESTFLEGLYFSAITFTTLGLGDLYPAADGICRQVVMVEAITGGCLMALFVVCLAKRFSRG